MITILLALQLTTTCTPVFGSVVCNGQDNTPRPMQLPPPVDYGAAIANGARAVPQPQIDWSAVGEAQRQWQLRHEQEKQLKEINTAIASDQEPALPAPDDEKPVLLACNVQRQAGTLALALYEKHARVDVTSGGSTHSRAGTFTSDSVTWTGPVFRAVISRLSLSFTGYGVIPAVQGIVVSGTCQIAQRQF